MEVETVALITAYLNLYFYLTLHCLALHVVDCSASSVKENANVLFVGNFQGGYHMPF